MSGIVTDFKADNLLDYIKTLLNQSINNEIYRRIKDNSIDFNDYLQILLYIYANLCDIQTFKYILSPYTLLEPIMLYQKNKYMIHVFSIRLIQNCLYIKSNYEVIDEEKNIITFNIPKTFNMIIANNQPSERQISQAIMNNILMLFCIADHATYHYKRSKNPDYLHEHFTGTVTQYITALPTNAFEKYLSNTSFEENEEYKKIKKLFIKKKNKATYDGLDTSSDTEDDDEINSGEETTDSENF